MLNAMKYPYFKYMLNVKTLIVFLSALFLFTGCISTSPRYRPEGKRDYYKSKQPKRQSAGGLSSPQVNRMRSVIEKYRGIPYKFGGTTTRGIDCSGFTRAVFREALGVELPRNSRDQSLRGRRISFNRLQFGDLIFFRINSLRISHVGIYLGNGRMVHAGRHSGVAVVSLDKNYYRTRFAFGRRL
ncbi:MAG: C40 family peptidase [Fibrobacterota bacterium]